MHFPQSDLEVVTILLIFLMLVLSQIFIVSLLVVFIRKIKSLLISKKRPYYYFILFYVISKMVICVFLEIRIIVGISDNWQNLSPDQIEICFKDTLITADISLIQMFLIAFEQYMAFCFTILQYHAISKIFRNILKIIQIAILISLLTLLLLFNLSILAYDALNSVVGAINCLIILAFLISFFYLNFKMTGLMIQNSINETMKKIYKVVLVLLTSRAIIAAFQLLILIQIKNGSFIGFIRTIVDKQGQYVTFAIIFICYIVFILITQGVPMMMSLRTSVVMAFNTQIENHQTTFRQSMVTSNTSVLKEALIDSSSEIPEIKEQFQAPIQLNSFKIIEALPGKTNMWKIMKASIGQRIYILRQIELQVSNYITQDILTEIQQMDKLDIKPLNKIRFFTQKNSIYVFQRYRPLNFDTMLQKCLNLTDRIKFSLKIALAIQKFHSKQIAHGCLKASNIAFDLQQNVYLLGYGLQSLKKYLSLTTDYTNKSFYTAVELLKDRNQVILRPKKSADIYSFSIILYQLITSNLNYRNLDIKQVKTKFCIENFRPKIPQSLQVNLKNLMRKCWQEDPSERPSIEYVIDVLKRLIG